MATKKEKVPVADSSSGFLVEVREKAVPSLSRTPEKYVTSHNSRYNKDLRLFGYGGGFRVTFSMTRNDKNNSFLMASHDEFFGDTTKTTKQNWQDANNAFMECLEREFAQ